MESTKGNLGHQIMNDVKKEWLEKAINEVSKWMNDKLDCYIEQEGPHACSTDLIVHQKELVYDLREHLESKLIG